ncbi:MAG: ribonuclease D [Pseudomonadota bacterium]
MSTPGNIPFINTADELTAFCGRLSQAPWIALDTEFLREKTYYPKLCLVQVATPDMVACIDPLALDDLTPLLDVIFDSNITKVMHAARQDMEIFYYLRGAAPAPIFDTQVAALLLGLPDQVGYGTLVQELLNVKLHKLHSRTDWTQRPLEDAQLHYAADDVIYLVQAYELMLDKLQTSGRLEWLSDDFTALSNPDLYAAHPENAWLRVKGANKLSGATLAILQALAAWRETRAQRADRPRGWLMRDDVLLDIARHAPKNTEQLARIRGIHENTVRKSGDDLLQLITDAAGTTPRPLPPKKFRQRMTPSQDAAVDVMQAVVRLVAAENGINPSVLANRNQLEQLLLGNTDVPILQGWRKQLTGEHLQGFLDGEIGIRMSDGNLSIC